MSSYFKKISIAVFLFVFSYKALALQLGQIKVNSTQDQPLNAEIELIVSSGDDLETLKVKIAGKDIYQAQSIERVPVHEDIKIFSENLDMMYNSNFVSLYNIKEIYDNHKIQLR